MNDKNAPPNVSETIGKRTCNDNALKCEVINSFHDSRKRDPALRGFDSVRSPFLEGKPPYTKAGFKSETHIQTAIRNPNCIKGFFLPRIKDLEFPDP